MARATSGPFSLFRRAPDPIIALGVLLLVLAACGEAPVLEVGPVGYTQEELGVLGPTQQTTLAQLTAFGLATAEGRVDELIAPPIRSDLRSLILQRVAMEMAIGAAGVDEAAIRSAYAQNPRHELVVRHLVVLSERWRPAEHRDSARTRAEEALARARAGEDFEVLVAEYSDEPRAAERGGLLEPGREGSWVPEFWEAASSLDEGEISDVVETEFGFHVIRLQERNPVPFDEVRHQVVEQMVDLPRALSSASEWVAGYQATMRVDTQAVSAWQGESDPGGPLIRWPDSTSIPPYTAADLEDYIRTARPETVAEVRRMDTAAALEYVQGTTRTHIMLARARREGIELSESQQAAIRQRWEDQVARWAEALGFQSGMSPSSVKAQALQALSAQAQSAALARSNLPRLAESLSQMYPTVRNGAERAEES